MTTKLRCMNWFALLAIAIVGCGTMPSDDSTDSVGQEGQPLFGQPSSYWPTSNDGLTRVPVCWNFAGYENDKKYVRDAVNNGWGQNSSLVFTGWGLCDSNTPTQSIRISQADVGPFVAGLGTQPGRSTEMTLNFTYRNWNSYTGQDCRCRDFLCLQKICDHCNENHAFCNASIGLHEFGHALGFFHEQQRPENVDGQLCDEFQPGEARAPGGGQVYGSFDRDSIMNYCAQWNRNSTGRLSAGDIHGVQQVYGSRPVYVLKTKLSTTKCMDLLSGGTGSLVENSCNFGNNQMFALDDGGSGNVSFIQPLTGKCLTMNGGNLGDTAQLTPCTQQPSQQFSIAPDAWDGGWFIQTALSGLTLTVAGASTADFTKIGLFYWTGSDAQKWFPVRRHTLHTMVAANSCMDVAGNGSANGTQIQEYVCNGASAQSFDLISQPAGLVSLLAANGKCVDIKDGGTAKGTKVQLWDCTGGVGQRFQVQRDAGGSMTFMNPNSGRCLDVKDSNPANQTPVRLWDCNGAMAQKWSLQ